MPINPVTGVYTPPAAAENAFPGKVIASADWNAIFTDLSSAMTSVLQNATPISNIVTGINFNSSNTDNPVTIIIPPNKTNYLIENVVINGASASISTATVGLYTAAAGGGTAIIVSSTAVTVTTSLANSNNNAQQIAVRNQSTMSYNLTTLYFRVQTPQGSAATANVSINILALP